MATKRTEDSTRAQLTSLSKYIRDLRSIWINSGKLFKKTRGYSIRPNFNLYYLNDPNLVFSIPVEHHEEEEWSAHNLERLISEEILASPQFNGVIASLHIKENEMQILRSFSYFIALQSRFRNKEFSDEALIEIAIADLMGNEKQYRVLIYLIGITLKDERVILNDSITLRKPTKEDVIEYVSDDNLHVAHAMSNKVHFSCICEARYHASQPFGVQHWADQIMTALELYRLGSVFSQQMICSCDSLGMFSHFSLGGSVSVAQRKQYELGEADAPRFNEFIAAFIPHFPTALKPDSGPTYLYTALTWYQDSLQSSKPLEGLIASSVACLEALFLHDAKSEEVMYRLKQRVSLLLGRFDYAPQAVRSILGDAYTVRSKYVHGAKKDREYKKKFTQQKLDELFSQTAEIARLSFLVHFQIEKFSLFPEKELYKLLEDAAVDDRARIQLDVVCKKVVFILSAIVPKKVENDVAEGEDEAANSL